MGLFRKSAIPGSGTGIQNVTYQAPVQYSAPAYSEFPIPGVEAIMLDTPWRQDMSSADMSRPAPYDDSAGVGPGAGPGLHAKPYLKANPVKAPTPHIDNPIQGSPGQTVGAKPVNDLAWARMGVNNGGLGAWINETEIITANAGVMQPKHAIAAPTRPVKRGYMQPIETGRAERYPMGTQLAAPRKLQSVPGYTISQRQVTLSNVNADLSQQYNNLRAPNLNESQGGMCS